mmetsp:Transcript_24984/g.61520  ORF Transcript_24984/g.61520 Transcript_24984/m.61520 type:complete len:471 (+) Transcript_24984:2123-3535(+)
MMMATTTPLRVVTLLLFLLIQKTDALNNNVSDGGHFENQTVFKNTNSSSEIPSNWTTGSPVTEAPADMIDPCQDPASWGQGQMNVFEKDDWEYRHVLCNNDDTLTPCTPEASCCECKLACKEGSNCTISGTSPIDAPTTSPSSNKADDSKNSGTSGSNDIPNIPNQPGGAEEERVIPRTSFTGSSGLDLIALFVSLVILLSCCINVIFILRKLRKRGLDYSRYPIPVDPADALTQPGAGGKDDPVYVAKVKRHEDIICKFHFRTIPYRGEGSSRSLKSCGTIESRDTSGDLECPTSPGSGRRRLQMQKKRPFWRRQARKDECCICLENYGPGDTICVPIANSCNHMFHEECVVAWLQHNNRCPLCRVDLMKEVKVVIDDDPPPAAAVARSMASSEAQQQQQAPTEIINIITPSEEMEEPHTSDSDEEAQLGQGESSSEDEEEVQQTAAEVASSDGQEEEEEEQDGEDGEL